MFHKIFKETTLKRKTKSRTHRRHNSPSLFSVLCHPNTNVDNVHILAFTSVTHCAVLMSHFLSQVEKLSTFYWIWFTIATVLAPLLFPSYNFPIFYLCTCYDLLCCIFFLFLLSFTFRLKVWGDWGWAKYSKDTSSLHLLQTPHSPSSTALNLT